MNNKEFIIVLLIGAIGVYYFLNYKRLKEQQSKIDNRQLEQLKKKIQELDETKKELKQLTYIPRSYIKHQDNPEDIPCELILNVMKNVPYQRNEIPIKSVYYYDEEQNINDHKIQEINEEQKYHQQQSNEKYQEYEGNQYQYDGKQHQYDGKQHQYDGKQHQYEENQEEKQQENQEEQNPIMLAQLIEMEFAKRENEYKTEQKTTDQEQEIEKQQIIEKTKNKNDLDNILGNIADDQIDNDENKLSVSLNCGLKFKPMHTDWRKFIIN